MQLEMILMPKNEILCSSRSSQLGFRNEVCDTVFIVATLFVKLDLSMKTKIQLTWSTAECGHQHHFTNPTFYWPCFVQVLNRSERGWAEIHQSVLHRSWSPILWGTRCLEAISDNRESYLTQLATTLIYKLYEQRVCNIQSVIVMSGAQLMT